MIQSGIIGAINSNRTIQESVFDRASARWRADQITGSSGSYSLTDLTGNGNHMVQQAGTLTTGTALNGRARIVGNASAYLNSAYEIGNYPVTVMFVGLRASSATFGFFGHSGASPTSTFWFGYESVDRLAVYNNSSTLNTTSESGSTALYTLRNGHGSRVTMCNGIIQTNASLATVSKGTPTTTSLGTQYRGFNGEFQECIVWDYTLSLDELDEVYDSLNTYYTLSVPKWSSYSTRSLIWIGGQSNASGRGDRGTADANIPVEYQGDQTGVNIWYGVPSGNVGTAFSTLNLSNNNQMLGDDAQADTQFGFETTIGKEYIDRVGGSVYIMKYATGGTNLAYSASLGYWHPTDGSHNQNNTSRMFGRSMQNYWAMLRVMQASSARPDVKSLAFYQGEQDSTTEVDALAYQSNAVELFDALKIEMGYSNSPKILIVRIHSGINAGVHPYKAEVRTAQDNLGTVLTNAETISVDSYTLKDSAHINHTGQLDLGGVLSLETP